MCGIFGLVGKRSSEVEGALTRGTRALAHRGPDDEGMECLPVLSDAGRCVALGARRLAILDLSPAGHQPMQDPQSGNWLVFNGEIFNFQEIRAELESLGYSFSSHSDTEVLLKAYGEWGERCLERLRGMFAFAVWNAGKETLFLARDRMGVKPLYYFASPDCFVFGSEVRALLASGLVPRRLDLTGLASYLAFGGVQEPLTMVEGVRSLAPGHSLVWQKDRCEEKTYWSLAEVASRQPDTNCRREAAKEVREILLDAVSLRLVSDVPLGVFLSGGVDSSSIVALASEASRQPLDTFSVVFDDEDFCEASHSDRVARLFACRHHKIELSERQLLDQLPAALAALDQPSVDGINTYVVSGATKKAGVTVALSGVGGDELFAGYSGFRSVPRILKFHRIARYLRPLGRAVESAFAPAETNKTSKLVAMVSENYPGAHPYFLSRVLFLPRNLQALLNNGTSNNGHFLAPVHAAGLVEQVGSLDPVNQVSVLEAASYLVNTLLRDTDCMSMAHSLEVRNPLLDHKLWEYVLPLHGRLKLDSGLPKPLLLQAVGPRLPEKNYLRRKMGFTLPFGRWMRSELRSEIEGELLSEDAGREAPLEPRAVAAVWKAFLHGKTSWSRPWSLYVLKQWIRHNL